MNINFGGRDLSIETGKLAISAGASCTVRYGDTIVLVTVCRDENPPENPPDFLPLTCDYSERKYAAGMIPGGFFKREGRPTGKEILTSRLIDRSIRPLFPKEWNIPVQVIGSVLSSDRENDADVLAILGASFVLRASDIPFQCPIGAVRVGLIGDDFILNPTTSEREESNLNLIVVASEEGVTMIETKCREIKEDTIVSALKFGVSEVQKLLEFQKQIPDGSMDWKVDEPLEELKKLIENKFLTNIESALKIKDRLPRRKKLYEIKDEIIAEFSGEPSEEGKYEKGDVIKEFENIKRDSMRKSILEDKSRMDGRTLEEIRPISCEVGLLPRTHGSSLFTRGETQSLSTVTLGTVMDEQKIEELTGTSYKSFMLHYNFPPFSVGEVRFLRGPGRREIGHGSLAEHALEPVIPSADDFPYTIRLVSDILSSNASSSMATVCGGSLALMDAGIPIKSHVAGMSIGLVGDDILVDMIGEEDHLGDMDFKLAGTKEGLNVIQLDIKTKGLKLDVIERVLETGKEARIKILEIMNSVISKPKEEISTYAPKLSIITVPKVKIGQVIGPGGKVIRDITEKTGAKVEISDEGRVTISADSWEATEAAKKIIEGIIEEVEVGKVYTGKITRMFPFGVIVELLPGKDGLLHISQLANYRVKTPEDEVKLGETIQVKVLGIDEQGKVQLSRKVLLH